MLKKKKKKKHVSTHGFEQNSSEIQILFNDVYFKHCFNHATLRKKGEARWREGRRSERENEDELGPKINVQKSGEGITEEINRSCYPPIL